MGRYKNEEKAVEKGKGRGEEEEVGNIDRWKMISKYLMYNDNGVKIVKKCPFLN